MNGVLGMNNLLLDTVLTAEQRDFARTIQNSGESLLGILNDILDFSKIEAGKLRFDDVGFDLRETVEEVVNLFLPKAAEKRVAMTLRIDPRVPSNLRGDPGRLRQVLTNLIGNAMKFTPAGEVAVEITAPLAEASSVELHFTVRDSGVGISPEAQRTLFQPFMQGDTSSTRRFGGTGLGLAISRKLVELMDGSIGVESVPQVGSRFWFTICLKREPAAAPFEPAADGNTATALPTRPVLQMDDRAASQHNLPTPLRILVAEDNVVNQKLIQVILKKMDCRCDVVANGLEVLTALDQFPYDLVLMDCHMPELDGYEATQRIRSRNDEVRTIPVIALTADAMVGARELCLAAGMNDYIAKPVRLADLVSAIHRCVPAGNTRVNEEAALPSRQLPMRMPETEAVAA